MPAGVQTPGAERHPISGRVSRELFLPGESYKLCLVFAPEELVLGLPGQNHLAQVVEL